MADATKKANELDTRQIPKKGIERIQYLVEAYRYHWAHRERELERYRKMLHIRTGEQWDKEDAATLETAKKPKLTFNHIGRLCDLLSGFERVNRKRVLARPVDEDDIDDSFIISQTLRYIENKSKAEHEKSQAFDSCIEGGEGILGFVEDVEEGEYRLCNESVFAHVPDRECVDRLWKKSNWHSRKKWMSRQAIRNAWPEKAKEIDEINPSYGFQKTTDGIEYLGAALYEGLPSIAGSHSTWAGDYDFDVLPEEKTVDRTDTLGIFYRESVDKFLVVETYERVFVTVDVIVQDLAGGGEAIVDEVPWTINEDTGRLESQDEYIKSFVGKLQGEFKIKQRKEPRVRMTVWAGDVIIEDGFTQYKRIPFVPYFWKVRHDGTKKIVQGFVERMVDAQDAYNKAKSQELHMINTSTGFIMLINKQLLRSIGDDTFEAALRTYNAIIPVEANTMQEGVDYAIIKPDNFPVQIFQNIKELAAEIPILGGISEEAMLGIQQQGDPSGWALEVKQSSQQMVLAAPFDNIHEANIELYENVVWPILKNSDISMRIRKEMLSVEEERYLQGLNALPVNMPIGNLTDNEKKVFKITDDEVEENPERRINDLKMVNVDFVLDEEKFTETERMRIIGYLGNLQKAGIPVPPLVIFEFLDEPVKRKILKVLQQNTTPANQPGPNQPPPAGPPVQQAPPPQARRPQ